MGGRTSSYLGAVAGGGGEGGSSVADPRLGSATSWEEGILRVSFVFD